MGPDHLAFLVSSQVILKLLVRGPHFRTPALLGLELAPAALILR